MCTDFPTPQLKYYSFVPLKSQGSQVSEFSVTVEILSRVSLSNPIWNPLFGFGDYDGPEDDDYGLSPEQHGRYNAVTLS